ILLLSFTIFNEASSQVNNDKNSFNWSLPNGKLVLHLTSGTVDYLFNNGIEFRNTVAYVHLLSDGKKVSSEFSDHIVTQEKIEDLLGIGHRLIFTDTEPSGLNMRQTFTYYEDKEHLLIQVEL